VKLAKWLYSIAAIVLVLFAAGHTLGFLGFKPASLAGQAVHAGMQNVKFDIDGRDYTYEGFYKGFGLTITAELLFAAVVAWHLGSHPGNRALGWALVALQLASLVLNLVFFFPVTWIFSTVIVVCVAWAAWLGG